MPSRPTISIDLFDRYRAGECTPSEAALVRAALADDPSLAGLEQSLAVPDTTDAAGARDASWRTFVESYWGSEVRDALAAREGASRGEISPASVIPPARVARGLSPFVRPFPMRRVFATLGMIAAVVAIGLGITTRGWTTFGSSRSAVPTEWSHLYATTTGERATVTLRDGSRVTLAPNSWLGVSREFTGARRVVSLRGEALFEVAGAARTPFLVQTGSVTTQVLGTTFDVRRYAGDRAVRVAVQSGRVRVATSLASTYDVTSTEAATVAAGMVAFATDSSVTAAADGDVARFGAWADGQLVFRDAPLSDVLATLSRWYGYHFELADSSLARTNLTMRVRIGVPDDAIATLRQLLGATVTVRDSTIWLSRRQGAVALPKARDARDVMIQTAEVGR